MADIKPTESDIRSRQDTIAVFTEFILKIHPTAVVHTVGSFATSLILPGSDLDITIILKTHNEESILRELASQISNSGIGTAKFVKSGVIYFIHYL